MAPTPQLAPRVAIDARVNIATLVRRREAMERELTVTMIETGRAIRAERKRLGATIADLADAAGLPSSDVSMVERGNPARLTPARVAKLSDGLARLRERVEQRVEQRAEQRAEPCAAAAAAAAETPEPEARRVEDDASATAA